MNNEDERTKRTKAALDAVAQLRREVPHEPWTHYDPLIGECVRLELALHRLEEDGVFAVALANGTDRVRLAVEHARKVMKGEV